jgi:hypothetical protein
MFDRITRNPEILNGQSCIRNLRISVRRAAGAGTTASVRGVTGAIRRPWRRRHYRVLAGRPAPIAIHGGAGTTASVRGVTYSLQVRALRHPPCKTTTVLR